jgi:hypothetical protein
MFRNTRVEMAAGLAVSALLGYLMASGRPTQTARACAGQPAGAAGPRRNWACDRGLGTSVAEPGLRKNWRCSGPCRLQAGGPDHAHG